MTTRAVPVPVPRSSATNWLHLCVESIWGFSSSFLLNTHQNSDNGEKRRSNAASKYLNCDEGTGIAFHVPNPRVGFQQVHVHTSSHTTTKQYRIFSCKWCDNGAGQPATTLEAARSYILCNKSRPVFFSPLSRGSCRTSLGRCSA